MSSAPPGIDELASTLIQARTAIGITQNELHKRTGISREAIKGYESGRNKPGSRELRLLCEALHVSPNMLLFGTETPFEPKGELFDMMQKSGQLDWAKLATLFQLLTAKEKESIFFLIESILLGRQSREELAKKLHMSEAMSALFAQMLAHGKAIQEGSKKPEEIDIEADMQKVVEFIDRRADDHGIKPG